MKITSTGNARPVIDNSASFQAQQDARSRAINKLSPPPQETPVANPNNISPEEMSALNVPTPNIQESVEEIDNSTPAEATKTVEPKKVEDPLSKQYAILAKREKALRLKAMQQEQAFKQKEEQLRADLTQQIKSDLEKQFQSEYISKSRLKNSPLEAFADADLTYDEVAQQLINQPQTDPAMKAYVSKLEAKIAKLEESIDNTNKTYTKNQEESYQAALKQIERDALSLVNADPEFETIKSTRSVKEIVKLIDRTWKEDGVVLSVEEAAREIEDYLVDEALKLSRIEKIQKRLSANASKQQTAAPAQKPAAQTKQPQPMKTLTNTNSVSRPLSARDRAIRAFRGELE